MSLCEKIASSINKEDFERFNSLYKDPEFKRALDKCASVQSVLSLLVAPSTNNLLEETKKLASAPKFDVVQIKPEGYGYTVKVSQAPMGMNPQEQQLTAEQAQQTLPPEAMQAADEQGVATMTQVQAQPDPMVEQAVPIDRFGTYKVTNAQNGRQIMGFVIPGLFDPMSGQPTQQLLFTNGSAYAIQDMMMGILTGVNFNLPASDVPRGLGIFYKTDGKSLMATVPYNIISEVTVEGKTYYSAQTTEGIEIQLLMSEGLKMPVASSGSEIIIPMDFQFLPLDNPIQIAADQNLLKTAQALAEESSCTIRAWKGGCSLSGPVFEKMGSGEHSIEDGLFYLAAAGCPQNKSLPYLEKAAQDKAPLKIYGLFPLSPIEEVYEEAEKQASIDLSFMELPKKVNLLKEITAISMDKEASALVGTATVDSVLALNFINPENISTFVEFIPQLKETSEKLASLVLASQLGLKQVPQSAAVRAMFALEDTIKSLTGLAEYSV